MLIFKRLTPYLAAAAVALLLIAGLQWPAAWWAVMLALTTIPILVVLVMRQPHWRIEYVGLSVPMIWLILGAYTFLLIQDQLLIIVAAIALATVFFFLFEKNLAVFLYTPNQYIPFSLEHISTYSTVLASFFVYTSLFTFSILRLARLRYIFLAALLLTAAMVWQTFWIQKIAWAKAKWFVIVISAVLTEVAVALYYWPVSFFVTGIVLTLSLYVLLHLSRHHLTNTLTRQLLWRYLATSSAALLLLLLTAQWNYI